jgi:hypothetical protein
MPIPMFYQQQGATLYRMAVAVHDGGAGTFNYKQPLIGSAMPIVRSALRITGCNNHLRSLHSSVAEDYLEAATELERFLFHWVGYRDSKAAVEEGPRICVQAKIRTEVFVAPLRS